MSQLSICLIIFAVVICGYVWGKYPMGAVAIAGSIALILTGCLEPKTALGNFGNSNLVMMLSMFAVAAGFNKTQFVKKVARSVNHMARGSMTAIMAGYIIVTLILTQFIASPMVVIGIIAPMMTASVLEIGVQPSKCMFAMGVTAIVNAVVVPIGGGATGFAELNGYLEASGYTEYAVGMMDPLKGRFPLMLVCVLYCIFIAPKLAPAQPSVEIGTAKERKEAEQLKPFQERAGYVIFIATSLALAFQKQLGLPIWVITLTGALLMIFSGVLSEKETFAAVPWRLGFLYAGSLNIAAALSETGAGEVLGSALAQMANQLGNPYLIGAVFFLVPFVLTQFMSNKAVMAIFVPIAVAAFKSMGANPVGVVILVQAACLTAFMTPMATGGVSIFMGFGGYTVKDVVKQSLLPAALFSAVSIFWIMTVFPM